MAAFDDIPVVARDPFADIPDSDAPSFPTQVITPSEAPPALGDLIRMKAGLPPNQPFYDSPQQRGIATTLGGIVPRSLDDLVAMTTLPRPSEFETKDLPESERLGQAWRGELGPEAQAQSISGSLLQALPLVHLPFADIPFRATPADVELADQMSLARAQEAQPPPIPPQYAERRFTMQDTPPEQPPQLAPAPPIEQTLPNIGQPLPFNPELGPQPQAPDFQMPLQTDMAQSPNAQPLFPTPPPGTPLKGTPLVGPNGSTPAADAAQAQPQPQLPLIPAGDEGYAGVTPQPGTGISQAATEAELGPGSVEPGIGAELGSGLEHGRNYVNKGGDPRLPIRRANTSGMVGAKDVGIVHAELERLRGERSRAAAALEASPDDPVLQQNFSNADNAQRAWRKELQPVLTKASDSLREAQAMSMPNADVSTYQGLADLMDEHFKGQRELSDEDRTALTKAAKGVKGVRDIANGEMKKVEGELTRKMGGKKVMTPAELDADLRKELEGQFSDCFLGK